MSKLIDLGLVSEETKQNNQSGGADGTKPHCFNVNLRYAAQNKGNIAVPRTDDVGCLVNT